MKSLEFDFHLRCARIFRKGDSSPKVEISHYLITQKIQKCHCVEGSHDRVCVDILTALCELILND